MRAGVLVVLGVVAACASEYSSAAPGADGGGGGGAGAAPPPNCSTRAVDDRVAVFVFAATGKDDDSCGTRDAPCKTIGHALDRAQAQGRTTIDVAAGTYVEKLALGAQPPLVIEGGWNIAGTTWTPICTTGSNAAVAIVAPLLESTTLSAAGANVTLRSLTIRSKDLALPGESLYGIFARGGARVALEDSIVAVAAGGDGLDGFRGGNAGDANQACTTAGDAANGTDGDPGTGSPAGSFTSQGYQNGDGAPGKAGVAGHNGSGGGMGQTLGGVKTCTQGIFGCQAQDNQTVSSGNGTAGCGGGGGKGGGGGGGGGSSVGVFAADATVSLLRTTVTVDGGGKGGAGGEPGDGKPGDNGATGTTAYYGNNSSSNCTFGFGAGGQLCSFQSGNLTLNGGTPGGKGGNGGKGGGGGGGAGGWSVAAAQIGNGMITVDTTTLATGNAGQAGAPGGAAGLAQQRYP